MSPTALPTTSEDVLLLSRQKAVDIPTWQEPPLTKQDLNWADLETLDLSLLDSADPQVRSGLIAATKKALVVDGFLFVTGTGVDYETLKRNLAIAQYAMSLPYEEKAAFAAKLDEGSYEGYKLRGLWKQDGGTPDNVEHFNLESTSFADPEKFIPPRLRPFLQYISSFAEHTYKFVVYRILKLISLALELPEDYLWDLHDRQGAIGADCQRFMAYFPRSKEDEIATSGLWSKGHTDYNSISLLWSQPISALQILSPDGQWKWVKHVPGAVVVNTADALQFKSGGVFPATRHRVVTPPEDQAGLIRYILIHFARFSRSLPLDPIWESPVVKKYGRNLFQQRIDAGGRVPSQDEWLRERIRRTGKEIYPNFLTDDNHSRTKEGLVQEEVLGHKVEYYV